MKIHRLEYNIVFVEVSACSRKKPYFMHECLSANSTSAFVVTLIMDYFVCNILMLVNCLCKIFVIKLLSKNDEKCNLFHLISFACPYWV